MTAIGWLQIALVLALVLAGARPLGHYMAAVFNGETTWLSPVLGPMERGFYRLSGVDPRSGQRYVYLETLGGGFGGRAAPARGRDWLKSRFRAIASAVLWPRADPTPTQTCLHLPLTRISLPVFQVEFRRHRGSRPWTSAWSW